MVHSDVDVSGIEKPFEPGAKDAELLGSFGQVRGKCALLLFEPRHVRVAEHGHAVGREREHLVDGVLEAGGRLIRQTVD